MNEERYGNELDECAEMLQVWHPIGRVKAIGRMEVTTALKDVLDRLVKLENVALLSRLVQEENSKAIRPILKKQGWHHQDEGTGVNGWYHPEKWPVSKLTIGELSACMVELDLALNSLG